MLLIKLLISLILWLVFIQDLKYRAVYWYLFPMLMMLFILIPLIQRRGMADYGINVLINGSFLLLQWLLVSLYFTIKNRGWVNITKHLLGWGDILLLVSTAFYLPPVNFLAFYTSSLAVILIVWLVWKLIKPAQIKIPLAGLQALCLFIIVLLSVIRPAFDATDDFWLTRYLLTI